mgnify:CR=1 FL=1
MSEGVNEIKRLGYKQPLEEYALIGNFGSNLGAGETLTFRAAVAHTKIGVVDDATSVIKSTLISASTVQVVVQKGTSGQEYGIKTLVSTSGGNVWEEDVILPVFEFLK